MRGMRLRQGSASKFSGHTPCGSQALRASSARLAGCRQTPVYVMETAPCLISHTRWFCICT